MPLMMPRIHNYGEYRSDNYGKHTLHITIGPVQLWFSYDTIVAFGVAGKPRVVHTNDWGPTTGKHLKWIDGGRKADRVSDMEFTRCWREQVAPLFGEISEDESEPPTPITIDRARRLMLGRD